VYKVFWVKPPAGELRQNSVGSTKKLLCVIQNSVGSTKMVASLLCVIKT